MVQKFIISKRTLFAEHLRHVKREEIVQLFADEIDQRGGLRGSSKTANKALTLGTKEGIKSMMERWFLTQGLYGTCESDPILPQNPKEDKWLQKELVDGGFGEDVAVDLEKRLAEICNSVFDQFQEEVNAIADTEIVPVIYQETIRNNVFQFTIGEEKKQLVVSKDYYRRLRKQYGMDETPVPEEKEGEFREHLLLLLFRYHDISTYELSLPDTVIKALHDQYGLQHECFSSPFDMSKHITSFCSRFPDTDLPFGSNGNFFHCLVDEGCYECNPPRIEEFLIYNMIHLLTCLEAADVAEKALTFFVVTPYWNEVTCQSYNLALYGTPDRPENEEERSKYYVTHLLFDKDNHYYRNGTAYRTDRKIEKAGQHSMMIVLQSAKARETVPIGTKDEFEGLVNQAWSLESEEYKSAVRMPMYNQGGKRANPRNQNYGGGYGNQHASSYAGKRNKRSWNGDYADERRRRLQ